MSICVVTDFLPGLHPTWGGAEIACERLLRLVQKAGEDVIVLTTQPQPGAHVEDIDLCPLPTCGRYLGNRVDFELKNLIPLDPLAYGAARRLLRRRRPRVVHLQRASQLSLSVVLAAWDVGIPVVFSLYDLWALCPLGTLLTPDGRLCTRYHGAHCTGCLHALKKPLVLFRKAIFDRVLPKIDRFICLSTTVVNQLADYGISRDKLVTLPLPLFDAIEPPHADPTGHTILFGGWVARTKGLHVLVEALPAVVRAFPDVRLNVMETGAAEPYRTDLIRRVAALGLTDHVNFLGKQSPENVKRLLGETAMVAVADQWGIPWPIFLTEAMAYARPIVASRVGDIPSFILEGHTGYLADRASPDDFARGILRVFGDPAAAAALGRNARAHILKLCDEQHIVTQLLSHYETVARSA